MPIAPAGEGEAENGHDVANHGAQGVAQAGIDRQAVQQHALEQRRQIGGGENRERRDRGRFEQIGKADRIGMRGVDLVVPERDLIEQSQRRQHIGPNEPHGDGQREQRDAVQEAEVFRGVLCCIDIGLGIGLEEQRVVVRFWNADRASRLKSGGLGGECREPARGDGVSNDEA